MNLKTPITYWDGKQLLLPKLLPIIPVHEVYTEAFCGGAALYFAKEPAKNEIINDLNGEVTNFYTQLKTNFNKLFNLIDASLFSRREYDFAIIIYNYPTYFSNLQRAWAFYYLSKTSFAAKINGTFGYDKQEKNCCVKKFRNAKLNFTEELVKRLENTQIENTDALKIIESRDSEFCFHFIDPPYFNSDCGHYKGYNEIDFKHLLNICEKLKGKFILTMYPCEIINEYIRRNNWNIIELERTISASKVNRRKQTELIVTNYVLGFN
jgi:DNA adenine methylase